MYSLNKEAYLFEYRQREQLADLEHRRQINEALGQPRSPHILNRWHNFWHTLNHVRRIRIEVTFDYQEKQPKTVGC